MSRTHARPPNGHEPARAGRSPGRHITRLGYLGSRRLRHAGEVLTVQVRGDRIASVGSDGFAVFDLATGEPRLGRPSTLSDVVAGGIDPSAAHAVLVTGTALRVVDLSTGGETASRELALPGLKSGLEGTEIHRVLLPAPRGPALVLETTTVIDEAESRFMDLAYESRHVIRALELTSLEPIWTRPFPTRLLRVAATSPDGERMVAGGVTGHLVLLDLRDGALLGEWSAGDVGQITALVFSPCGRRVLVGASKSPPFWWDLEKGAAPSRYPDTGSSVTSLALSPDGAIAAIGSLDGEIRIASSRTGEARARWVAHIGSVSSLVFTEDADWVVSAGVDHTIRRWSIVDGRSLDDTDGHDGFIESIAIASDGSRIATGSYDGTVRVWDARTRRSLFQCGGHAGPVRAVAISSDGGLLVSGSKDGTVRTWDMTTGSPLRTRTVRKGPHRPLSRTPDGSFSRLGEPVASLALSPDGSYLAIGGDADDVTLRDPRSLEVVRRLPVPGGHVHSLAFAPAGRYLLGATSAHVLLWDTATSSPQGKWPSSSLMHHLGFARDGHHAVAAASCGTVLEIDPADLKIRERSRRVRFLAGFAFDAAGRVVWVEHATHGFRLVVIDPHSWREIDAIELEGAATCLAVRGRLAVVGNADTSAAVFDVA